MHFNRSAIKYLKGYLAASMCTFLTNKDWD